MSLEADLSVQLDRFTLELALRVEKAEVVALVGANGAGKTTVLSAIAGLVPLERGRVSLGGVVLDDPAANVWVPPEAREIGFVFQDGRLFPHMTAFQNIAFGLRARGIERPDTRAAEWLERMGLGELGHARASTLSGGEARKVALARALAMEPRALLLDEPFASLDEAAGADVRETLRVHLNEFYGPCLLVTHEPEDARMLADRTLRIAAGRSAKESSR
jgi:molybdate transport system ATP-binding protein